MRALRELVPSADALVTFEVAARHLSFTRAAAELGVSQPAVSRSVQRLEQALGLRLFVRLHRALVLTEAGERLYRDVALGLTHIYASLADLRRETGGRAAVTVSGSTAFATYWLLPRMARFRQRHPDIDLRFQATDRDIDLVAAGVAIGIRMGEGNWPEYQSWHFVDEEVYAVCSPSYLNGRPPPASLRELARETLIHLDEPYRPRIGWADWFRFQGVKPNEFDQGLHLNDYAVALQAALEGQGVALGWRHLVDHLLARGQLVQAVPHVYRSDRTVRSFYVVAPAGRPLTPQVAALRDWLLRESHAS